MWEEKPARVILYPSNREFIVDRIPVGESGYLSDLLRETNQSTRQESSSESKESGATTEAQPKPSTTEIVETDGASPSGAVNNSLETVGESEKTQDNVNDTPVSSSQNSVGETQERSAISTSASESADNATDQPTDQVGGPVSVGCDEKDQPTPSSLGNSLENPLNGSPLNLPFHKMTLAEKNYIIWQKRQPIDRNKEAYELMKKTLRDPSGIKLPKSWFKDPKPEKLGGPSESTSKKPQKMAGLFTHSSIKLALQLHPCSNPKLKSMPKTAAPSSLPAGNQCRSKNCMMKKDHPHAMFEAMVDEMKDLYCSRGLKNHRTYIELETKLSPIEILLQMADVPVNKMDNRYLFLVGQVMLRSTYKKKKHSIEEVCLPIVAQTKEDGIPKIMLPKNVLPDVVTDQMVDHLYRTILLRMEPRNAYIAEWFDRMNQQNTTTLLSIPRTTKELKILAVSFLEWFRFFKSSFFKDFQWEEKETSVQKKAKTTQDCTVHEKTEEVPTTVSNRKYLDSDDYTDNDAVSHEQEEKDKSAPKN